MDNKTRSPVLAGKGGVGSTQNDGTRELPACSIDDGSFADPVKYPGLFKAIMRGVPQILKAPALGPVTRPPNVWMLQYARPGQPYETISNGDFENSDLPLEVDVPDHFMLMDGAFDLRLFLVLDLEMENETAPLRVIKDWIPPYGLPIPHQPVVLELPDVPITSEWLADNKDELAGTITDYPDREPGDMAYIYWLKDIPDDLTNVTPVAVVPLDTGLAFSIPASAIAAVGDGLCFAFYALVDAAGNPSLLSEALRYAVNLGPLPDGLQPPYIPQSMDGVINIADLFEPVQVQIRTFLNHQATDEIEIFWAGEQLAGRYFVGEGALFPLLINIPADLIARHFTDGGGRQTVQVRYRIMRQGTPYDAPPDDFLVNLDVVGPTNPDWPDPINPDLDPVAILSDSGAKDHLTNADTGKDASATIALDPATVDGHFIQLYWNGAPVLPAHEVDPSDVAAGQVIITVPWAMIEAQGNGLALPVHYSLADALDADNAQLSGPTPVHVEAVELTLPVPQFVDEIEDHTGELILNCSSLRQNPAGSNRWGFQVYIRNDGMYLLEGNVITLEYTLYEDMDATRPIAAAGLRSTTPLTREHELYGVSWFIGPYEDHILPLYDPSDPHGSCSLTYSLRIAGQDYEAETVVRLIGLWNGSETCRLPPRASAASGTLLLPIK
jgi:hypothetical protein